MIAWSAGPRPARGLRTCRRLRDLRVDAMVFPEVLEGSLHGAGASERSPRDKDIGNNHLDDAYPLFLALVRLEELLLLIRHPEALNQPELADRGDGRKDVGTVRWPDRPRFTLGLLLRRVLLTPRPQVRRTDFDNALVRARSSDPSIPPQ